MKGFQNFWKSFEVLFKEAIVLKEYSFSGIILWSSFFWYFLNFYIKNSLELFDNPAPLYNNCTFNQQHNERKGKEKQLSSED